MKLLFYFSMLLLPISVFATDFILKTDNGDTLKVIRLNDKATLKGCAFNHSSQGKVNVLSAMCDKSLMGFYCNQSNIILGMLYMGKPTEKDMVKDSIEVYCLKE